MSTHGTALSRLLLVGVATTTLTVGCWAQSQRIAVPTQAELREYPSRWENLTKYLKEAIPGSDFVVIPMAAADIPKAIRRGEVEFAVTPASKMPMALAEDQVAVIASFAAPTTNSGFVSQTAGSVLVLQDRTDLTDLAALREKKLAVVGSDSLTGWVAPSALLRQAKLNPEKDLAELRQVDRVATALEALQSRDVDAVALSNADLVALSKAGQVNPTMYRVLQVNGSTAMDAELTKSSTEKLPLDGFVRAAGAKDATALAEALFRLEPGVVSKGKWVAPTSYRNATAQLQQAGLLSTEPAPTNEAPVPPLGRWSSIVSGLISLIACLSAFRLYRVMRSKEKAAKETVETTLQSLEDTQQALAKASEMRVSLLSNIRQDFRTPLTAVLEISRLLRTTPLSSAQAEYVNVIRETTHNLMGSIGNVTDFANLEAGALQIEKRDFDLTEMIDGALQNVYEQMGEHHAELSAQVDINVPRALQGDPARIRIVLQNLLHNAMKHTSSGDVLLHVSRVRDDAKSAVIRFTVIDTGTGISKKQLSTIFEPYVIAGKHTDEARGLGLPLSKLLVEKMGGEISATSDVGKGTQVSFSLQLVKQSHAPVLLDEDSSRVKGSRVLLIGGREISRRILQYYLQSWNAQVVYSPRFEDAIDVMKREAEQNHRFDVVLSPAFVGERNAVELVATVRDHPEFDGIPFVSIASRQECEALPQLEQLAGVLILPRPIKRGDLLMKLSDALRMEVPDRLWKDPSEYDTEEIQKLDFEFSDSKIKRGLVLVADSNSTHQRAVGLVLGRMGYEVENCASGSEALQLLRRRRYEMVFLDTRLRDIDGFTVASELRDHEQRGQRTPLVGMLTQMQEGEREHCLLSGMDDCILKPLDMEAIARTMRRWMRKPQKPTVPSREDLSLRHEKLA